MATEPGWWYCRADEVSWNDTVELCFVCGEQGLPCWQDPYGISVSYLHNHKCWADNPDDPKPDGTPRECQRFGNDRAGLCRIHAEEILGDMCHVSDVEISEKVLEDSCV